jgi:hypothetical protein
MIIISELRLPMATGPQRSLARNYITVMTLARPCEDTGGTASTFDSRCQLAVVRFIDLVVSLLFYFDDILQPLRETPLSMPLCPSHKRG